MSDMIDSIRITKSHPAFKEIDSMCRKSKDLWNRVIEMQRKMYPAGDGYLSFPQVYRILKESDFHE